LRKKLWFLHGNLQTPKVWTQYKDTFTYLEDNGNVLHFDVEMVDLWVQGTDGLLPWAEHFSNAVAEKQEHHNQSDWLVGYSLGGRLALHAVLQQPSLWAGAIIVGADAGFASGQEKIKRLRADQVWGRRFLDEPWDDLAREWDAQPIFAGRSNSAPRDEHDFNRNQVSHMFDVFSNGRQQNLIPALSQLSSPPILYVSGEEDPKYCEIGRRLGKTCQTVTHAVISSAAHRVPWENQGMFTQVVQDFIKTG
jgi:2-succinyl-6-hydroxy-2,4-cyclohexadiene-1-carboxylate synthase